MTEQIPPQALDIEEIVLGTIITNRDALNDAMPMLDKECFYNPKNAVIFECVSELVNKNNAVDVITVAQYLKDKNQIDNAGGLAYIAEVTNKGFNTYNILYHARIIKQKAIAREAIRIGNYIAQMAYDPDNDIKDVIENAEDQLYAINNPPNSNDLVPMHEVVNKTIKQVEFAANNDGLIGIPTLSKNLDALLGGWIAPQLTVLAARPAMGKTAFALACARDIATVQGKNVVFFSCEMAVIELGRRLVSAQTGIYSDKLKKGELNDYDWNELDQKIRPLEKANLWIDDTPGITVFEIRAKLRRLKQKNELHAVFIDYLQLMEGVSKNGSNREQEVSGISRGLKAICKDFDIPVIALSQLNRSVESRAGDKRPQLSDLRESGAIEQDADNVIFVHRPEYYDMTSYADGTSCENVTEIIVSKCRDGALDKVKFHTEFAKMTYTDLETAVIEKEIGKLDDVFDNSDLKQNDDFNAF